MNKNGLTFQEARKISIIEYLNKIGFEPAKVRGHDYWYHSPFRHERTPSFKVNTKMNVWYDHGSGEGGSIIDLGAKLNQCTLSEFLDKLAHGGAELPLVQHKAELPVSPERKLEIIAARDLTDADLLHYVQTRGISAEVAKQSCKEVDFKINERMYKAIGFPNRSGAFELRNHWFKGSSSPKDISLIDNRSHKIAVLEGFIDYLSLFQLHDSKIKEIITDSDFLILNSLRLIKRSEPIIRDRPLTLFLDNDKAAEEAKHWLLNKGISFEDLSILYKQHKDVNDYLKSVNRTQNPAIKFGSRLRPR